MNQTISLRGALCATAALGLLSAAAPAWAEDAGDSDSDASPIIVTGEREHVLEQKTDTGSRLGISALETPASVNLVYGDDIRARGDISIVSAVSRAPGVTNAANPGNGNTSLAMRGFGGADSVLQLYDGVRLFPVASSFTFPTDPWNIERIEVLNGPASVLYGQGALGGAVNYIPKQPNAERWEAEGELGYGSQDTVHAAAGMAGPLGHGFSFRADASYRQSDGYVDRGDSSSMALSGALRFEPSDSFSLTLRDDYGTIRPQTYFGTPLIDGKLDTSIRHNNYNVGDALMRFRDNRLQLDAEWAISDNLQFRNTAYKLNSHRFWRDLESYCWVGPDGDCPNGYAGGTPGTIWRGDNYGIDHNQEQIGDQATLKLDTPLGGSMKNTLLVGVDASRVKLVYGHDFDTDYQEDNVPINGFDPGTFLDTVGIKPRYRTRTDTYAFFLEDRLAITDQLSVVGGLRYEHNKVGRWAFDYDPSGDNIIGEHPTLNGGNSVYKKLHHTTWRVGVVYEVTPNLSLYGQYATAVDPLGTLTTTSNSNDAFQLTNATGKQFEAGIKGQFLDGMGMFTLAAYRIEKNNLFTQKLLSGPINQIGQRSSQGIEASLAFNLPGGFAINANGAILKANFDDYVTYNDPSDLTDTTVYTDNTPPGVPEQTANLELSYSGIDKLQLRGNLRYVGRRFSDDGNAFRIPSYTVVDLSASYALTDNVAVDVRLYNAFNEAYAESTYNDEQWILGRPRSFDVSVRAAF